MVTEKLQVTIEPDLCVTYRKYLCIYECMYIDERLKLSSSKPSKIIPVLRIRSIFSDPDPVLKSLILIRNQQIIC